MNTKTKRVGALFQNMFKGVRMESDEQFVHVARYIHLNPFTSFLFSQIEELEKYQWSSYGMYLEKINYPFVNINELIRAFSSKEKLRDFTIDQADYQRELGKIKHLVFEIP